MGRIQDELTVCSTSNIILWETQIITRKSMQERVVDLVHQHIIKTKTLLFEKV